MLIDRDGIRYLQDANQKPWVADPTQTPEDREHAQKESWRIDAEMLETALKTGSVDRTVRRGWMSPRILARDQVGRARS